MIPSFSNQLGSSIGDAELYIVIVGHLGPVLVDEVNEATRLDGKSFSSLYKGGLQYCRMSCEARRDLISPRLGQVPNYFFRSPASSKGRDDKNAYVLNVHYISSRLRQQQRNFHPPARLDRISRYWHCALHDSGHSKAERGRRQPVQMQRSGQIHCHRPNGGCHYEHRPLKRPSLLGLTH